MKEEDILSPVLRQPEYWSEALGALAHDNVLSGLIAKYPGITLQSRGDPFATLARSIVGQQISVRAADSVWQKFSQRVATINPQEILRVGNDGLQGCGLSQRKIEYVIALASAFAENQVNPLLWQSQSDQEIITSLSSIRGIGRWTVEMFLIFTLMRPDVFPLADIGLQRAVSQHYFAGKLPPLKDLAAWSEQFKPWRTVFTWYMWRSLDPVVVEY